MKTCSVCRIEKHVSEFYAQNGRPRCYCKECDKARGKARLEKNRSNPEWVERERLRTKRRYARDKERPSFAEREKERVRRQREGRPYRIRSMFYSTQASAKKRGIPFNLTKLDIANQVDAQTWKCAQTGIQFDLTSNAGQRPFGPTVDRIDNERGYEPGNIQIVCYMYNCAKNRFNHEDVLTFAREVVARDLEQTIKRAA
jgi:hypothetical protein